MNMNPIFIPPASDDVESNPFDRDDSSSSGSISSESSSEGSRDESYGDDEAPLEEQGVQFSWNQDTPEYDDELEIKASPPPPGTSHANGWRSRLNSPAFLIGSAGLFLILAIVVGVGPWRDSGSSSSTNRANGLGSQTPPPVDFFASPAPTAAVVSRTDAPTAAPVPPATTTTSTTTTQATTTTSTTNTTTSTTTEQPPVTDTTTEQPPQTTEQPPTTDETPTEDPPTEELPTEEPPTTIETAGNWGQATKITYDNGVDQASFGTDVAVEDGTMVASAVNYESGSGVYVFSLGPSEWSPEPEILMGEGVRENDRFGACVDISGDTIIVGAPYENIGEDWNVGSVYVFVRDSEGQWIQQDKLVASDGASADRFGAACAIDKGTIVVGAPYADTEEDGNIGAGYVFVRDEDGKWSEQAKLLPDKENSACSESMGKYRLGTFVDINVDMVVLSPDAGLGCRRVHIFTQDGDAWSQTQEVGEDGTCAYAVSMTGRRMALGDSCAEVNGVQNAGLVTMMNRGDNGQWSGNVTITAENPGPDDFFGTDVAINGRFVLVGMSRRKSEYGGAFLYREGSGGESWDLEASMKGGERSGSSIALHNGIALLDASRDSDLGENMGGVYVFAPLEDLSPDSPERPTPEQPSQVEPTTEAPTASPQEAEPEEPEETEEPEEPEPDDDMPQEVTFDRKDFATALDVDRGTMIVSSSGGAHIFTNGDIFTKQDGEWMHETDLVVPELPESSGFGSCVAISGDFAVVGAPNQNDNTGAAYIFTKRNGNSWEYHSTLSMTDSDTDDLYGSSCDISGGNLVVGAPKADSDEIENGQNIGAAYLYRYSNEDDAWNLENKVFPDGESECKDHFKNYKFGSVVSIDKNTVAIGPRGNGACQKAHIFALTSVGDGFQWMPQVELGETTDSENCGFSLSVSQRGKAVAIGDPCYSASDELVQIGKVSVYSRAAGPWELLGNVLLPRRPMANEMFGSSISLDGTNLLVGMMRWGRDDVAGGAWRYSLNENFNWERKELYEADEVSGGGNSVVLTGNTCMLGAPKDDGGSVLVFTFESEPDLQEEEEPAEGGSTGEEPTEEEPSKEETTEEPPAEEEPAKEGPTKEEPAEPEPAAEEPAEEEPAKEEPAEEKPAE